MSLENPQILKAGPFSGKSDSSGKVGKSSSQELSSEIPMSNEQMKEWIPEKVGDLEQRKLIVGHKKGMGMSGAISTYSEKISEGRQVSMEVLDGAGATGAVMINSIIQKLMPDYEEKKANGYSKIYEREGMRVWEKLNLSDDYAEIEFVSRGRFHFIFKGYQISLEELWVFIAEVKEEMS